MDAGTFTPEDEARLAARGLGVAEALRQLRLMADPPGYAAIERPCTLGDGIERLDAGRLEALLAGHAEARDAGRVTAFVPASGAASRMFKDLQSAAALPGALTPAEVAEAERAGRAGAAALLAFARGVPRLAMRDALSRALAARALVLDDVLAHGPWRALLEALLAPDGLDAARRPKALLPFHRDAAGVRTAFEEHFVEAGALARDARGVARLHFTVSPEHRGGFEALRAASRFTDPARAGTRFEVGFSEQHPATDTLAADPEGGPFRGADGSLLFRPAGHGALLRNLGELRADLVFLKNIDNVAVDRLKPETARWSGALVGLAAGIAARAHALCARLERAADAAAPADAEAFLREVLGQPGAAGPPASRAALLARLDRPVRVCGMVPNTGEPGGGPFWVRGEDGALTRQVVESAQVAPEPAAQEVLGRATHFNPVFMACALLDHEGRPHDLGRYVDERAVIVTRKSSGGRDLLALERPGLWNGAMAGWHTLFVEVPLVVFNPVKTVLDLLRPEHQG